MLYVTRGMIMGSLSPIVPQSSGPEDTLPVPSIHPALLLEEEPRGEEREMCDTNGVPLSEAQELLPLTCS